MRSLRARFVVASFLWTGGLLAIAHFTSMTIIRHRLLVLPHQAVILVLAAISMGAGFLGVRRGLSPFRRLRANLAAIRRSEARRLEGGYPTEVQPLVDELNALIDDRDRAVRRALERAADLAHGLKTPLAVLLQEADRMDANGDRNLADEIRTEVGRMLRQADFHLAQARAEAARPGTGARACVRESAEGLARTLRRLHANRGIDLDVSSIEPALEVGCSRENLDEMLGNLIDNACKWSRRVVRVESAAEAGRVTICVDDDGPGVAPSMREAVLRRGVRADEAGTGSGLGLAIVRDLAELHGGSITLEASPRGGLRARLSLPAER